MKNISTFLLNFTFLQNFSFILKWAGMASKKYRTIRKACFRTAALLDNWEATKSVGRLLGIDPSASFDAHPCALGRKLSQNEATRVVTDLHLFVLEATAYLLDVNKLLRMFEYAFTSPSRFSAYMGVDCLDATAQLHRVSNEAMTAVILAYTCAITIANPYASSELEQLEAELESSYENNAFDSPGGEQLEQRLAELLRYVRALDNEDPAYFGLLYDQVGEA